MERTRSSGGIKNPPGKYADKYNFYEQNETIVEDQRSRPGPVLRKALKGKAKKGRKGPSAAQVGDALAQR